MRRLAAIIGLLLACLPREAAMAQPLSGIANTVAGPTLWGCQEGVYCIIRIAEGYVGAIRPLLITVATVVLILAGFTLIVRNEEGKVQIAKRAIGCSISAMILALLSEKFVAAFYGNMGEVFGSAPEAGAMVFIAEGAGLLRWFQVIIGSLAVTMIIISGVRAVASFGAEEGVTQLRRTVVAVLSGLLIIGLNAAIQAAGGITGYATPAPLIAAAATIVNGLFAFIGIAAVTVIVYAGAMILLNMGNEEQVTQSRGIVARALIGLAVVAVSYMIVEFVIGVVI